METTDKAIHTEEALGRAMAQAASRENEAMRRVMGGLELRGHVLGSSMQERVDDFAEACGTDGKTVPEVARILGLPMSTVQTHCHRAVLSGAVRKVQHSRRERATFYDARGEKQ